MSKIVMNDLRNQIVNALASATSPMTLSEIAQVVGVEKINSGTTNPLVEVGILKVGEVKKVPVITYREVNTYSLDSDRLAEVLKEQEQEKSKKQQKKVDK